MVFYTFVFKTIGKVFEVSFLSENKWRIVRVLRVLIDRDVSSFFFVLVVLFVEDVVVVFVLRDYFVFWIGEKKAFVFKEYDGKFW